MKLKLSLLCITVLFALRSYSQTDTTISIITKDASPDKITFINIDEFNDFENDFSQNEQFELKKLMFSERKCKFIVVTTSSYDPYESIQVYAKEFSKSLPYNKDNIVVFALCRNKQNFYILTGSKIENILTPPILEKIIGEEITTEFRDGDFYSGIKKGILAISKIVTEANH